jgi:putative methionine-R-sulfoxide reductase with GAF domain
MSDAPIFPAEQPMAPRLAALLALNHALYTDHDLDVLLHRLLGMVTETLDAEAASLGLIDAERNELVFQIAVGTAGAKVENFRLPMGKGVAGWVAQHREAVRVHDAQEDPRFLGRIDQATGFQTRSLLVLPLLHGGRILGVLEAINKRSGPFTDADESLCAVLANTVAVSLENFQLHQLNRQRLGEAIAVSGALDTSEQELLATQELLASNQPTAGFLTSFPLAALLRVLGDSHVTGKLFLKNGTDEAEIALDHGDLVTAWLPRRRLVGAEVVLETLGWTTGVFRFEAGAVTEPARTITEPLWLLLVRERARRERLAALTDALPADRTLCRTAAWPMDDPFAQQIAPLLPASLSQVTETVALDRLALLEGLARLIDAGSLEWAEDA